MSDQSNAINEVNKLKQKIHKLNAEFELCTERHQMVSIQYRITGINNRIERLLDRYDY